MPMLTPVTPPQQIPAAEAEVEDVMDVEVFVAHSTIARANLKTTQRRS
jgi:hypothetical protein